MPCVYWIHSKEHTDIRSQGYIGFTIKTAEDRFKKHCAVAKRDIKRSGRLGTAIRKYGAQNLIVKTLLIGSVEYCLEIEKALRPEFRIGWNLGIGGEKPTIGRKATAEERAHFSKVHTGRKHSEEWKKMMSEKHKGKKFRLGGTMPEDSKKKIGLASKNIIRTDEWCKKISSSLKGKKFSKDHKMKLSIARKRHLNLTKNISNKEQA